MRAIFSISARLMLAALLGLVSFSPIMVAAQNVPSYARPNDEQTIHGRIRSVDGPFNISVADDNGYIDSVQLHQGTIINPTGLTLAAGMSVTIIGYNAGSVFQANEIDTPYRYSGPLPLPVYYGPGWWYPGFAYGWGPSYGLNLLIGGGPGIVQRPFRGRPFAAPVPGPHPYIGRPGPSRAAQGHPAHPIGPRR